MCVQCGEHFYEKPVRVLQYAADRRVEGIRPPACCGRKVAVEKSPLHLLTGDVP